ncbi:MAG: META domain-containing protein [Candidatus Nanopelagicales bacterium]|jgi:heat shock protein HslJ|nr:META domain-containing protein [Candidatus Nanopelagicales bacterium]
MKRHLTALALVVALGATGGCAEYTTTGLPAEEAGVDSAEEVAHGGEALEGTSWTLDSAAGDAAALGDFAITASFLEGTMSGQAPVNRYTAEVELGEGGELAIGPVAATKMAGPEDAMAAEATYFALLEGVTGYAQQGEMLELLNGSQAILTFVAAGAATQEPTTDPMDPSAEAEQVAGDVVGMSLAQAEAAAAAAGLEIRVASVDGDNRPLTSDFRPDRITVVIVDDVITEATVG